MPSCVYFASIHLHLLQISFKSLVGLMLLLFVYLMNQIYMVKKSQLKPGVLLKMHIVRMTHFTLVNLDVLTV